MKEKRYCPDCYAEVKYLPHNDVYNCSRCQELIAKLATLSQSKLEMVLNQIQSGGEGEISNNHE